MLVRTVTCMVCGIRNVVQHLDKRTCMWACIGAYSTHHLSSCKSWPRPVDNHPGLAPGLIMAKSRPTSGGLV